MNRKELREAVMTEQDNTHRLTDGDVPDHIIFSKEIYDWLDDNRGFENLRDKSYPKRPGYLGMKVWWSKALDERDKAALLISDEVFEQIVTRAEDYKRTETFLY